MLCLSLSLLLFKIINTHTQLIVACYLDDKLRLLHPSINQFSVSIIIQAT